MTYLGDGWFVNLADTGESCATCGELIPVDRARSHFCSEACRRLYLRDAEKRLEAVLETAADLASAITEVECDGGADHG